MKKSLQEKYAPACRCFGCGAANPKGLRIKSYVRGGDLVAKFVPKKQHEAYAGMLSGGIIAALLDCHSNWAAAYCLMKRDGRRSPPTTVTAELHVEYRRPTPTGEPLELRARATESEGRRVYVKGELRAGSAGVTVTSWGVFEAVKERHAAFGALTGRPLAKGRSRKAARRAMRS